MGRLFESGQGRKIKKSMHLRKKIILLLSFSALAALLFSYLYWSVKGRWIIQSTLEKLIGRKVSFSQYSFSFPLKLKLKELVIGDLAKIDSLEANLSPFGLLSRSLYFNQLSLKRLHFIYERGLVEEEEKPDLTVSITPGKYLKKIKEGKRQVAYFGVRDFAVSQGVFEFVDKRVLPPDGLRLVLKDVSLRMNNLFLTPFSTVTEFNLTASIPWKDESSQGSIKAEGWVNIQRRSLEAKISIQDIDGLYFYPYYYQWVNLERANIEKAILNLDVNMHGLDNSVTVHLKLELKDLVFRKKPVDEPKLKEERVARAVMDIFKSLSSDNRIVFEHSFKTRMDKFEFGFNQFREAVEEKLKTSQGSGVNLGEEIFLFPGKILLGVFRGLTNLTSVFFKGVVNTGREATRAVGESFRKKGTNTKR